MCEFCIKHGEGEQWYKLIKHYSRELFEQDNRERFMQRFLIDLQKDRKSLDRLDRVRRKMPLAYRFIRKMATCRMKTLHFGQVVPLEDAQMIITMVQSITRLPCVCRKITKGDAGARYCLALGIDPQGIFADYPDLKKNLEVLPQRDALELIGKFDEEGLVHSIWTFKTPFIGALCNCDRDCLAYRIQVSSDLLQIMFKAEYVANIDSYRCTGCRSCQKLCQFGALEYSFLDNKCIVNVVKCYGCGVCRRTCTEGAINLMERRAVPEAASLW